LRTYELLAIVQPNLEEEPLNAVVDSICEVMTENGGEIVHAEVLGKRRLAYEIKRQTEGFYVLVHANLEPPAITELERMLRLSEDVLRHLLLRLDEFLTPPVEEEPVESEEAEETTEDVVSEEIASEEIVEEASETTEEPAEAPAEDDEEADFVVEAEEDDNDSDL